MDSGYSLLRIDTHLFIKPLMEESIFY